MDDYDEYDDVQEYLREMLEDVPIDQIQDYVSRRLKIERNNRRTEYQRAKRKRKRKLDAADMDPDEPAIELRKVRMDTDALSEEFRQFFSTHCSTTPASTPC